MRTSRMLVLLGAARPEHKVTRGEAVIALLSKLAPAPDNSKPSQHRPGEPEIPTSGDVDWPATEDELKNRN